MSAKTKDDYQSLSQQLDQVMEAIQEPDVSVDKALAYYDQGMEIIEKLQTELAVAENRIKKIKSSATPEQT